MHWDGHQTAYVGAGNQVAKVDFKADSKMTQRVFLSEILSMRRRRARRRRFWRFDHRWRRLNSRRQRSLAGPLAERLVKVGGPPVAVLNEGISGAKVLSDRMGTNALARFDRDVLGQPKADTVILMMGINDLGWPGAASRCMTRSPRRRRSSKGTSK